MALHLPGNRGSVVDLYGPKAIFCGNDAAVDTLGGGVIHISVAPSQLQSSALDEQVQDEIANHFQPRLLMYRLKNSGKVRESQVDVSQFTFATRQLACTSRGVLSRRIRNWRAIRFSCSDRKTRRSASNARVT